MTTHKNYKELFRNWYSGFSCNNFDFNNSRVFDFAKSAGGIFAQVVDSFYKVYPTVVFTNEIQTAAVDVEKNVIFLPLSHLIKKQREDADIFQVLLFYNGQIMHESAHLRYTEISMAKLNEFVDEFDPSNRIMDGIYQIVEDLFIDNQNFENLPNYSLFTDVRLDYLFSNKNFTEAILNLPTELSTKEDIASFLNTIFYIKNPANRGLLLGPEYFSKFEELFLSVINIYDQIERCQLAVNIYKELVDLAKEVKDKMDPHEENDPSENEDDDENKNESDGDSDESENKNENEGESEDDDEGEGDELELDEEIKAALQKVIDGLESKIEPTDKLPEYDSENNQSASMKLTIDKRPSATRFTDQNPEDEVVIIESELTKEGIEQAIFNGTSRLIAGASNNYEMSETWVPLVGLLQARSQTVRYNGLQQNHGTKIRQLYRIATDNKIFTQPVVMDGLGPQEVIILVDLSASMRSGQHYIKALNEAWGMAVALEAGRHRVAVYGHTADQDLKETIGRRDNPNVTVWEIKNFDHPSSIISKRLENVTSNFLCNNGDGYAIKTVAEHFSNIRNSKTLIVISDGEPAAHCYGCEYGNDHTREAIQEIRNRGIKVLAVSVIPSCIKDNNWIYGEENNFPCTTINVVELMVNRILQGN